MRALGGFLVLSLLVIACGGGSNTGDDTGAPACSDGKDNDGDGMTDFPDDLACASEDGTMEEGSPAPQCDDNRDNDGDGKKDYPHDPGCFAPQADDESDDCPSGPNCSQCSNGKDDDSNGATDYPNDTGCESAADNSEFLNNATACGAGMKIKQLPATGMDMGQLEMGSTSQITSSCGGGGGVFAVAYVMHLTEPKVIVATTDMPGTATDTIIDIRSQMCAEPTAGLACNDDISMANERSTVTKSLGAGVYYIIVQGQNASVMGSYQLSVTKFAGEGSACSTAAECGPGLLCRVTAGGTGTVCAKPVCDDGLDDDGDGKTDYPNDPGCGSPVDDTENDMCPSGPGCPECGNNIDDDNDTQIDYPMDTTCKAAGDSSESCVTTEGVALITGPLTPGDTATATHDTKVSCASSTSTAKDLHYRIDVPTLTSLTIGLVDKVTPSWDAAVALYGSTCGGTELGCADLPNPETITISNVAAGTYYFVVDGWSTTSVGSYKVGVSGKLPNGASCENTLGGAFTCGVGYACKGPTGGKTCQLAQCGDNIDNNGNGPKDYPADPGCESTSDDTETTVCPGAMCPACSNGTDDDMDGQTDYPADNSCVAASGTNEACASADPITVATTPATMSTTVGLANDTKPSCASSSTSALAPDKHLQLDLPATTTLTLSLTAKSPSGWDSVIALYNSSCGGAALSCQDSDTMTMTNLAAGRYFFVVDGYSTSSGAFTFNVAGKIANGASCESPLAQSGALTCGANHVCKGPTGSKTCQPTQCVDGIDNNNAGGIDYPNDPGCSSPADDMETTVCPGAGCPVCANTMDDDTDGVADYPMDFGCSSAGGSTEAFCAGEPDYAMSPLSASITTGNLMAAADNYDQTCQSTTGNDMAFALHLPVPVASLVIDTDMSTVNDTVLSLKDASCGVELACDDDGGASGLKSKITAANVPAGNYAIQVDSYSTSNNGAFTLQVKGTVAAQTACSHAHFAAGILACPTGTTCTGTPKKCQ